MIKKLAVFVFVGMLFCVVTENSFAKEPKEFVEEFFAQTMAGRISEAYDGLFSGSNIPEMKPQAVEMVKRQTASGLPIYGSILGYEKIREEKFGTSVVRLVYILKSEQAPTIWEFYFYKPTSDWVLAKVLFNDQLQLLESKE